MAEVEVAPTFGSELKVGIYLSIASIDTQPISTSPYLTGHR
jgi:hypothetical protein